MVRRTPKGDLEKNKDSKQCKAAVKSWTLGPALVQGKNQTQILNRNERQALCLSIFRLSQTQLTLYKAVAFTWEHSTEVGIGPQ